MNKGKAPGTDGTMTEIKGQYCRIGSVNEGLAYTNLKCYSESVEYLT